MKKVLIANWKLNPLTVGEARRLARAENRNNVVIVPPLVFLEAVAKILKTPDKGRDKLKADLGAQDLFWENSGPYTGEVSADQLKSLGVKYVIIGHSERRKLGETDEMINKKVKAALQAGLKVILCVGEPWSVRKKGIASVKNFVKNQLQKDLENWKLKIENLLIAYEPVWAIGTGKADEPAETTEIAKFIKKLLITHYSLLHPRILYGGSVTAKNAAAFLSRPEIDGALVGGASLRIKEFKKLIEISGNS